MTTEQLRNDYNAACREWLDATDEERELLAESLSRKQTALIEAMEGEREE